MDSIFLAITIIAFIVTLHWIPLSPNKKWLLLLGFFIALWNGPSFFYPLAMLPEKSESIPIGSERDHYSQNQISAQADVSNSAESQQWTNGSLAASASGDTLVAGKSHRTSSISQDPKVDASSNDGLPPSQSQELGGINWQHGITLVALALLGVLASTFIPHCKSVIAAKKSNRTPPKYILEELFLACLLSTVGILGLVNGHISEPLTLQNLTWAFQTGFLCEAITKQHVIRDNITV